MLRPLLFPVILALSLCTTDASTPQLRHVFDIRAEIGTPMTVGPTSHGQRIIIPITGGEVTGEITGRILPGGADYQLVDTLQKRAELKAIYTVMTQDSVLINVTNEGINSFTEDDSYFITAPKFECDRTSPYAWLNNRLFICRPVAFPPDAIILRVWEVQ